MTGYATRPIVVLDTNIVLDWLVFEDGGMPELMAAINARKVVLASNQACIDELIRVLAYPTFKLDQAAQTAALEKYLSYAQVTPERPSMLGQVPRCRDKDDQKFLELAAHARAVALISKDNAVLGLKRSMKERFGCEVLGAAKTAAWLAGIGTSD
jgi:putative PIN family toxin of toxin-antitoxin system